MKEIDSIYVSKMTRMGKSKISTACCDDSMGECDFDY